MTAPERFAESQIPLAPRAPSIHDPKADIHRSDELQTPVARNLCRGPGGHSMISSALTRRVRGTVRPSAVAVPRLMTNSNLVGCMIGVVAVWYVGLEPGCPCFGAWARSSHCVAYSITCVARTNMEVGISIPSAFAVFKFNPNSNVVGCSTGKSAGFVPLRILSTYDAASLNRSK